MRQTTFLAGLTAAAALTLFAGTGVASAQSRERDSERRGQQGQRRERDHEDQEGKQGQWGQRGRDNENDEYDDENDDHDDDNGVQSGRGRRTGTGAGQCVDINGQRYCDSSRGNGGRGTGGRGTGQCVNVNGQTYCDNSRTNGGRATGQCVNVNGQLYCDNSGVSNGTAGEDDYNIAQRPSRSGRHNARSARRGRGARAQLQAQLGQRYRQLGLRIQ